MKCACWSTPGPLGYLSIAAHGHADALSFVLNIGDREILVDPGTYAYHTDPAWRRYFRSTLAHNTVGIDGEDQSVQAGNFMWTASRAGALHRIRDRRASGSASSANTTAISGSRTRWCTGAKSCSTRDASSIEVTDMLRCEGEHRARRSWHFAEDCQVERVGYGLKVTSGPHAGALRAAAKSSTACRCTAAAAPEQGGWVSRSFGRKEPCTTVHWNSRVTGVTVLRTRITYTRSRPVGL